MTSSSGPNRREPLGGRAGATIAALTPFLAVALFVIVGFAFDAWAWAWVFFLAVPIVFVIVYGPGNRSSR